MPVKPEIGLLLFGVELFLPRQADIDRYYKQKSIWKVELMKGIESSDPEVSANVTIRLINIISIDQLVSDLLDFTEEEEIKIIDFKAIQIKWFGTHEEYDKIDVTSIIFKKKKS